MAESKKFDFEKAFQELEKIVAKFEQGQFSLKEGLREFERGLELAEKLKKSLIQAKQRVIEIKKKFDNTSQSSINKQQAEEIEEEVDLKL